ncbi:MAG: nucleotidyltransferase domain-containing protein [Archaeoglobaceae archaeon]
MQKKLPRKVIERVDKLITALHNKGIEVESVYLFGSYARNDHLMTSDIDLIVVSDSWSDLPTLKRMDVVNEVMWKEDIRNVEVIPITSTENEQKNSIVLRDASKYWIKLN